MTFETVVVSRKTPGDGRLEIPAPFAERLRELGDSLRVRVLEETGAATIEAMQCSCAKAAPGAHAHHFLVSPLLRGLVPETVVSITLEHTPSVIVLRTESPS